MSKKIVIVVLLLFAEFAQAGPLCPNSFSSAGRRDVTNDFMAYLSSLLESHVITQVELEHFTQALESDALVNPIPQEKGSVSTAALMHYQAIQEYIDKTDLDSAKVLQWARENLKKMLRIKGDREDTQAETYDMPHQKMEFFPIPPGRFSMGGIWNDPDVKKWISFKAVKHYFLPDKYTKSISVKLTHKFEMMSTQVTQKHWVDVMGENPSGFTNIDETVSVNKNGKMIKMQPDHPVESVSWWSALVFANRLSEEQGLKPVYDLSRMVFKGSAEQGNLEIDFKTKMYMKLNAPMEDVYLAEGYRLPTAEEQEYVRKNLGWANGAFYFGSDELELKNHAWYRDNGGGRTHAVAQLEPLLIRGNPFYDLYGNVAEWAHSTHRSPLGDLRETSGGSWASRALGCRSVIHTQYGTGRFDSIGFRLVRTIK